MANNFNTLQIGDTSYAVVPDFIGRYSHLTSLEALNNFHSADGVQFATGDSAEIAEALGGGFAGNNGLVLSMPGTSSAYGPQIFIDDDPNSTIKFRQRSNNTGSTVYSILSSGNYTNYTPAMDGTGASGTGDINISGNAGSTGHAGSVTTAGSVGQVNAYSVAGSTFKYGGNIALGSGSPASAAKTFGENNVPVFSMVAAYNNNGKEYSFLFSKGGDNRYGTILRGTYGEPRFQILRMYGSGQSEDGEGVTMGYADHAGYVSGTTGVM